MHCIWRLKQAYFWGIFWGFFGLMDTGQAKLRDEGERIAGADCESLAHCLCYPRVRHRTSAVSRF